MFDTASLFARLIVVCLGALASVVVKILLGLGTVAKHRPHPPKGEVPPKANKAVIAKLIKNKTLFFISLFFNKSPVRHQNRVSGIGKNLKNRNE